MENPIYWTAVHKAIATCWNNGIYDFDNLIKILEGYQAEFKINIKENKDFLKNFCEVLFKEHREGITKGLCSRSYPAKLVDAIKDLAVINYAKPEKEK